MRPVRRDVHLSHQSNWLRAAVLANDGIVSTAGLVLGVLASRAADAATVTAGIAGLVAGALSMAAGDYVSVSSSATASRPASASRRELRDDPSGELRTSAVSFSAGVALPLLAIAATPAAVRVVAWGAGAMAVTAGIGALVGALL